MLVGEPLRQQDQRRARCFIINGEERFQQIKAIAGDGVVLKRRIECSHLLRGGCTASGSITGGGLQRHDIIGYAATIEGPRSLDLATRHNA
jgi:hypothetical protein